MKKKDLSRREFLKGVSLTGLGLTLAACVPVQQPAAQQEQAAAEEQVAQPPAETIELTMWGWWDIRMELYRNVATQFMEANPEFEIKVESISGEYQEKVYSALAAGTGPDMLKMRNLATTHQMREQDLLLEFPEDIFPVSWFQEAYPYFDVETNGRYVLPTGTACTLLMYNKAMFAEAGLDPEAPPTTWDEFIEAAKAVTQKDGSGNITRTGFVATEEFPALNQIYQLGGNVIQNDGEKQIPTFTSPEVKQAYQHFADLAFRHEAWDPAFPGNAEAIGTGLAAMTEEQTWMIGEFANTYADIYPDLGFTANPTPTGKPEPLYGYKDTVTSISALTGHPENYGPTFQFMDYLYKDGGKDAFWALCELIQLVPERADLADDPRLLASPGLSKAAEVLAQERNYVAPPERASDIMVDVLHLVAIEGAPIDEALEFGDTEIQKLIDEGLTKYWI